MKDMEQELKLMLLEKLMDEMDDRIGGKLSPKKEDSHSAVVMEVEPAEVEKDEESAEPEMKDEDDLDDEETGSRLMEMIKKKRMMSKQ